jgi:hypothetical protein
MLQQIRKNKKLILWILLALIVPPFIFFGIESAFVKNQNPMVGILFGKKVLLEDFFKARTFTSAMLSLRQPGAVDASLLDQLTWQRLIFLRQAKQLGIQISNSELSEAIVKDFTRDRFDTKAYELFVKQALKLSVFEFENAYRETLLIEKFQETLSSLIQVTEDEVYEGYLYEKEKLSIRYCEIPFDGLMPSVQVSEEEMKKFFSENRESFRVGVQRSVIYFAISLKDFEEKALITPKRVEDYYRNHREEFKEPLVKISAEIENKLKKEKVKTLAQKTSKKIYHEIYKGKSIKAIEKKYALKLEKIDFFTADAPPSLWERVPGFIERIFESELNEPLEPFFHQDIYYVLIPIREKPSYLPEFDEMEGKVRDILIEEKAREAAKKDAEKLQSEISQLIRQEKLSFSQACQKTGKDSVELPPFSRLESRFPNDPFGEIKRTAWDEKTNQISDVVPTGRGYAFFIIEDNVKPSREEFEKEKAPFLEKILNRKRQKAFYEYYDWLLRQCQFFRINQAEL